MLTVVETPTYLRSVTGVLDEQECEEFTSYIASNPSAGDVIRSTKGLRKVRWARSSTGKSGGARVIYFYRAANGEIVLLIAYAKAKFDNLPAEFLKRLKEQYDV
jgi:hypothetical protein